LARLFVSFLRQRYSFEKLLILLLQGRDLALSVLFLTAIFLPQVLNYAVQLHVLPLKHVVVTLKLVELVLEPGLLLQRIIKVSIELLVILDKKRVLVAETSLHLLDRQFLLFLPIADESFYLGHAGRLIGEAGKSGPRGYLVHGALVADLLHLG